MPCQRYLDAPAGLGNPAATKMCAPLHWRAPCVVEATLLARPCPLLQLDQFTDDRRSCNKSLTSHNRRRRGVPRSAPRAGGDSSSGGSGGRRQRRTPRAGTDAATATGIDTGSSGSIQGGDPASPQAAGGSGGEPAPASAAAAAAQDGATTEGSKSSATPPRNGYVSSPAGSGGPAQDAPRHNSAPPPQPAEQPFLPALPEQGGLPWLPPLPIADRPASAPPGAQPGGLPALPSLGLPPWQGAGMAPLQAQDEEGRNFDSVLMGLLLADSPRANGEARQQHAHAALLDAYGTLMDQPVSACR